MKLGYQRLRGALRSGTTHLEAKSGYGLDTASELRLLRLAEQLNGIDHLPTIDPHMDGCPRRSFRSNGNGLRRVTPHSEQLPRSRRPGHCSICGRLLRDPGGSRLSRARTCSRASRNANLDLRMHVDEFVDGGGGDLAATGRPDRRPRLPHLHGGAPPDGLGRRQRWVPARYTVRHGRPMADMGAIVEHDLRFTLASDFNPNCKNDESALHGILDGATIMACTRWLHSLPSP